MRLRRRRPPAVTVAVLLESLRRRESSGRLSDIESGQLEGLCDPPAHRARMMPHPEETLEHHGSYLLGKLLTFTEVRGMEIDEAFVVPAMTYYCMGVAERSRTPDVELRDPRLGVHTYAMVRVERALGEPLPVAREEQLLTWLVSNLGMRPVEDAAAILGRKRARRIARLFPDPAPPS